MSNFKIKSHFTPTGDQPKAINSLVEGFKKGNKYETLLGVTGSGKTFTMAHIIKELNKPTLIMAHNKTLAAQLYEEFKEFFPDHAVKYFISYYDYYRPEAYVPNTDTFIEKDSLTNEEIEKMRHAATAALATRDDVIIIASVSCIFGLGSPADYKNMVLPLEVGMVKDREEIIRKLVEIQYERNDVELLRGAFRVRGDVLEILPIAFGDIAIRVEMFGDEIVKISEINALTGKVRKDIEQMGIYPASHYMIDPEKAEVAIQSIEKEMNEVAEAFRSEGKFVEAQRIEQRTNYDIEMIREAGHCNGIENYSRHVKGLEPGSPPDTLMDFFGDDYLLIIDESHMTVPQIRSMYAGDQARKSTLVDYGFRLPSSKDNRPLNFKEFEEKIKQVLFVSATPGPYEYDQQQLLAEQIIRPTGLLDPNIEVKPTKDQDNDLMFNILEEIGRGNKVLVTTLTKRMAEDLTDFMNEAEIRVRYLHSDIDTLERIEIIRDFRLDEFDVLIGINLLREGLDLPEVALVAILDADKGGFLRSETALIQTIGRAARNEHGRVIMYADRMTNSMKEAIEETKRRRAIQDDYNKKHGITPQTIKKAVRDTISVTKKNSK